MIEKELLKAKEIAKLVKEAGGKAYFVGGFVRDRLMGREQTDVDMEIHGVEPDKLFQLLGQVGTPLSYGSSFGIYSLAGLNLDVAIPRRERATGSGHRDFEVFTDPYIGIEAAASRRDFTVNALMQDVLTGEVTDCFGGRRDLEAGILRHVSRESFSEDPLRVLRAARFAAGLGFRAAEETADLCRSIDISMLSSERVEGELKKALLSSKRPSVFFEFLRETGKLEPWFRELTPLIGQKQDPLYHPEGDVWTHTMQALDRAAAYREKVREPYAFMLLVLTHDLGKAYTTEMIGGRIHSYGHETAGLPPAESLLKRITGENRVIKYVLNMLPLHMKPNVVSHAGSALKVTNRMFDQAADPEGLIYFSMCDSPVMAGDEPFTGNSGFLFRRLEEYRQIMDRPHVTGRDLAENGIEPGPVMGELLKYAHKLRLAGADRESALRQVLGMAGKTRGKDEK